MACDKKYLMYGFVPVTFESSGQWYINVRDRRLRCLLSKTVRFLLKVNSGIEAISGHQVKMTPPMVPLDGRLPILGRQQAQ